MQQIPLHRVAVVLPFTNFLRDVGAPVESAFRRAGLPFGALEDVNNYVVSTGFWSFLVDMVRTQGIEDLGFRVGRESGVDSADPRLSNVLRSSPTLHHGISRICDVVNKTVCNSPMGLAPSSNPAHTLFFHRPSCGGSEPPADQIGWYGVMTLIDTVRVFTGPTWAPSEIGLMTRRPPFRSVREEFPDTRFRLSQPYSYISLEQQLLGLPPLPRVPATGGSSRLAFAPYVDDFAGALELMLGPYVEERGLSVDHAAELAGTSKRTLQRKLEESGTCYSELLDRARYHAASTMLQDPDITVNEIALRLGYTDSANFSRAFRRIAGISPSAHRRSYAVSDS